MFHEECFFLCLLTLLVVCYVYVSHYRDNHRGRVGMISMLLLLFVHNTDFSSFDLVLPFYWHALSPITTRLLYLSCLDNCRVSEASHHPPHDSTPMYSCAPTRLV